MRTLVIANGFGWHEPRAHRANYRGRHGGHHTGSFTEWPAQANPIAEVGKRGASLTQGAPKYRTTFVVEPFKEKLNRRAIDEIATNLAAVEASFPKQRFVRDACRGLASLELKARVTHIIAALHRALPGDYLDALRIIVDAGASWRSLTAPGPTAGFAKWPIIDFVGTHGLGHPAQSLDALRRLTSLFSAEFAVRPFIVADTKLALAHAKKWTNDPDEHVRRLASEGFRPRLPWGARLVEFQEDPSPVLDILVRLKDDPSEYVRRSVANNLNDIAKDHAPVVVRTCRQWSKNASPERKRLIRHALRSLIKAGDPAALAVLGHDSKSRIRVGKFQIKPRRVTLGGAVTLSFELCSREKKRIDVVVDFAVHHVKARGPRTAKVFKLKNLGLDPGERVLLEKQHHLRQITTRRYHTGRHCIELLVNGKSRGKAEFDLRVPKA